MKVWIMERSSGTQRQSVHATAKSAIDWALKIGPFLEDGASRQSAIDLIEGRAEGAYFFVKEPVPCDIWPNAFAAVYVSVRSAEMIP